MTSDRREHTLRVALAGGGTGGHIIPALAIAEQMKQTVASNAVFSDADFLFFGSDYGLETKLIPEAGYNLITLPVRGLSRSFSFQGIKRNLSLPSRLLIAISRANKALQEYQPHILVGTGGYASAIPVRQSLRNRIPVVMQEQNSYPGMVTRLFAQKAAQVFLTYADAEKYLKGARTLLTGNPIREGLKPKPRSEAAAAFGLKEKLPTLFILGGSQGAQAMNRHFISKMGSYLEKLDIQVLWQTGRVDYEHCQRHLGSNPRIKLVAFIEDMAMAYSIANLMVCRAGAMTLTEINHFGLPAILIPLPTAAGNHQEYNARSQEVAGAARIVHESDLGEGAFLPVMTEIFTDKNKLRTMMTASKNLRRSDAASQICEQIIKIVSSCETH